MEYIHQDRGRMYLPFDQWSPRFEASTFYTVKVENFEIHLENPPSTSSLGGKSTFPAYYYTINVYSGRSTHTVYRRYSQFYWLYQGTSNPKGKKTFIKMLMRQDFSDIFFLLKNYAVPF